MIFLVVNDFTCVVGFGFDLCQNGVHDKLRNVLENTKLL